MAKTPYATRNKQTIENYLAGTITRNKACHELYEINQRLTRTKILDGTDSPDAILYETIDKHVDNFNPDKASFITFIYFKVREAAQVDRRKDTLIRDPKSKVKTHEVQVSEIQEFHQDESTACAVEELTTWLNRTLSSDSLSATEVLKVSIIQEVLDGKTRKSIERKYGPLHDLLEDCLSNYSLLHM